MVRRASTALSLALLLVASLGCSSTTTYPWSKPRTHEEYSKDRDVCLRKHTFAVVGESSGECLHCELFALCMQTRHWHMAPDGPPDGSVPCCRGTVEAPP